MLYNILYRTRTLDYREVGGELVKPEWRRIDTAYTREIAGKVYAAFTAAGIDAQMVPAN